MQTSHIIAQQGSLLAILGTTMHIGYGLARTLCLARARRAIHPHNTDAFLKRFSAFWTVSLNNSTNQNET